MLPFLKKVTDDGEGTDADDQQHLVLGVLRMTFEVVPDDVAPFIDQANMPQIHEHSYADMFVFLGAKGLTFEAGYIDSSLLKLHQEVDVAVAMALPPEKLVKPILISKDNFVLDGDHRGYRHFVDKTQAPFIRINALFYEALGLLLAFPETYKLKRGE